MDRSPGFGSARTDLRPLKTRFPSGSASEMLNLASPRNSPDRSTKSTRSHLCRAPTAYKHRVSGSLSLPSRGPFHLSFTVLCSIGHWVVFRLTGWSPLLPPGFLVSRCTLDSAVPLRLSLTGLSPSPAGFPKTFLLDVTDHFPRSEPQNARALVWPLSRSLAATWKIDVSFFSSPY